MMTIAIGLIQITTQGGWEAKEPYAGDGAIRIFEYLKHTLWNLWYKLWNNWLCKEITNKGASTTWGDIVTTKAICLSTTKDL
jgi:hypothetical protein